MSEIISAHHDYWDAFYASKESGGVPEEPSAFARWTDERLGPDQVVLEFGFGTGRDSLWFADRGHGVIGFDFAESAVGRAQGEGDARSLPVKFVPLDLCDADGVRSTAKEQAEAHKSPAVYGRFLIHSLEADGRGNLLDLAATVLDDGGELYLEFRTGQDQGKQHVFGDEHFRVYLDPEVVVREVEERGGTVTDLEQGHGFAVYKTEDPHVARIVARWTGSTIDSMEV